MIIYIYATSYSLQICNQIKSNQIKSNQIKSIYFNLMIHSIHS